MEQNGKLSEVDPSVVPEIVSPISTRIASLQLSLAGVGYGDAEEGKEDSVGVIEVEGDVPGATVGEAEVAILWNMRSRPSQKSSSRASSTG